MRSIQERIESGVWDQVQVADEGGNERTVYNTVTVSQQHRVGSNTQETFTVRVEAGDGGIGAPDAVSPEVGRLLTTEYGVDLSEYDINVIDPTAEEVDFL